VIDVFNRVFASYLTDQINRSAYMQLYSSK